MADFIKFSDLEQVGTHNMALDNVVDSDNESLKNIMEGVDSELHVPFRLRRVSDYSFVISAGVITNPQTNINHAPPNSEETSPLLAGTTIDIPASTAGNITAVAGGLLALNATIFPNNTFIRIGVGYVANGTIKFNHGTANADKDLATKPVTQVNTTPVGEILLHNTGGAIDATPVSGMIGGEPAITVYKGIGCSPSDGLTLKYINSAQTLESGFDYQADSSAGGYQLTLPKGKKGDKLALSDADRSFGVHPVELVTNPADTIDGLPLGDTFLVDVKDASLELNFDHTESNWVIDTPVIVKVLPGNLNDIFVVSANYSINTTDTFSQYIDRSAGGITFELPPAADNKGKVLTFTRDVSNPGLTVINATGGDKFSNRSTGYFMTENLTSVTVKSDGIDHWFEPSNPVASNASSQYGQVKTFVPNAGFSVEAINATANRPVFDGKDTYFVGTTGATPTELTLDTTNASAGLTKTIIRSTVGTGLVSIIAPAGIAGIGTTMILKDYGDTVTLKKAGAEWSIVSSSIKSEDYSENILLNGNFNNWDYDTSSSNAGYSTANRWKRTLLSGATGITSRQLFVQGTQPLLQSNPLEFMRVETTSAGAATSGASVLGQAVIDPYRFQGQFLTVFFGAKSPTNSSIALEWELQFDSASTDLTGDNAAFGGTGVKKIPLTTTIQKFSHSVRVPEIGAGIVLGTNAALVLNVWASAGSDYNARTDSLGQQPGSQIDLTEMMLVRGTAPSEFRYHGGNIQTERDVLKEYFFSSYKEGTVVGTADRDQAEIVTAVHFGPGGGPEASVRFPRRMRATPTISIYHPGGAPTVMESSEGQFLGDGTVTSITTNKTASVSNIGDGGFHISDSTQPAGTIARYVFHYVADAEI